MDSKEIKHLIEAYNSVYSTKTSEECIVEDYSFVDNFTEEELSEVAKEVVEELVFEGYDFDDIEEVFITEAYEDRYSKEMKKQAEKAKSAKRDERKQKIAGAVKGAINRLAMKGSQAAVSAYNAKRQAQTALDDTVRKTSRRVEIAKKRAKESPKGIKTALKNLAATGLERLAGASGFAAQKARKLASKASQKSQELRKEEIEILEGLRTRLKDKVRKHVNQYAYHQGIHSNPGWLRKPEKRAALNTAVRSDIKKNPGAVVKYVGGQIKKKITRKQPKTGITGTLENFEFDSFDYVIDFLISEGIANNIEDATWVMANIIDEQQLDEILGIKTVRHQMQMDAKRKREGLDDEIERDRQEKLNRMNNKNDKSKGGYTVDTSSPEKTVTQFNKKGETRTYMTRRPV